MKLGKVTSLPLPVFPLTWRSVRHCAGISVILGESAQGSSFKLGEQALAVRTREPEN